MTLPALPPKGSTDSYPYLQALDNAVRNSTADAEMVRDTMAATLVAGTGVTIAADDAADTITISATGGGGTPPAASDTVQGVVELATPAEAVTGTDTTRVVTPAGLKSHTDAIGTNVDTPSTLVRRDPNASVKFNIGNFVAVTVLGDPSAPEQVARKAYVDTKAPLRVTQTTQTGAAYTFVVGDANTLVEGNSATAQTFTVPQNVFTLGDSIAVRQYGAGQITIAAGTGTTARSRGGALKTAGQFAELTLTFRTANEFVVSGDVTT